MNTMTENLVPMNQRKWIRRAGMISFWFFMVKGLLWLAAPLVFYYAL